MNEEDRKIHVSHINIRQSISFLILKLLTIEIIAAFFVIALHGGFFYLNLQKLLYTNIQTFVIPVFILLVLVKSFFTFFVIFQWLNDYYEISALYIINRSGIIFRKEEKYPLDQVAFVEVDQDMFGRMLNYGTIRLFSPRRFQYLEMYLIHNPIRYANVIRELIPHAAEKNILFGENIIKVA